MRIKLHDWTEDDKGRPDVQSSFCTYLYWQRTSDDRVPDGLCQR